MTLRLKPNWEAIVFAAGVADALLDVGDKITDRYAATAPRSNPLRDREPDLTLATSLQTRPESDHVTVYTDVYYAHWIEWGTRRLSARAPLRNVIADLGLRLEPA